MSKRNNNNIVIIIKEIYVYCFAWKNQNFSPYATWHGENFEQNDWF